MYLVIDCTQKDAIRLALVTNTRQIPAFVHQGRQVDLLRSIDAYLQQEHVTVPELLGVCAVTGEGSFTSSRLSVLCANVFHFVHGTPVCALDVSADQSFESLQAACTKTSGYTLASYSGLPNIRV